MHIPCSGELRTAGRVSILRSSGPYRGAAGDGGTQKAAPSALPAVFPLRCACGPGQPGHTPLRSPRGRYPAPTAASSGNSRRARDRNRGGDASRRRFLHIVQWFGANRRNICAAAGDACGTRADCDAVPSDKSRGRKPSAGAYTGIRGLSKKRQGQYGRVP